MIHTMTTSECVGALVKDEYANWSVEGATAIVEHLEQLEEVTREPLEFDRVAIRCDYHEYKNITEALQEYRLQSRDELEGRTFVLDVAGGGVIIQTF